MNSEKNNIDMSNVINKLFEGDCLEYMKKIPDGSVDMILCDLPYEESACNQEDIRNPHSLLAHNRITVKQLFD